MFVDAAAHAVTKAQPGTPAFRVALRDALIMTKDVVGIHGVRNFKVGNRCGSDERARVLVKLDHGQWKLIQGEPAAIDSSADDTHTDRSKGS